MLGLQRLRPTGDREHDAADEPREGARCEKGFADTLRHGLQSRARAAACLRAWGRVGPGVYYIERKKEIHPTPSAH